MLKRLVAAASVSAFALVGLASGTSAVASAHDNHVKVVQTTDRTDQLAAGRASQRIDWD